MRTKSADEIINMIAEVLSESDGNFIATIANKVLTEKVNYINDSLFEITEE